MAAPLARMMPPTNGKHNPIKINGRTYSCAIGGFIDVPTFDAHGLSANRWTRFGGPTCFIGPTSARPITSAGQPLAVDQPFFDTTLNMLVTWSQSATGSPTGYWRGPTGAQA